MFFFFCLNLLARGVKLLRFMINKERKKTAKQSRKLLRLYFELVFGTLCEYTRRRRRAAVEARRTVNDFVREIKVQTAIGQIRCKIRSRLKGVKYRQFHRKSRRKQKNKTFSRLARADRLSIEVGRRGRSRMRDRFKTPVRHRPLSEIRPRVL